MPFVSHSKRRHFWIVKRIIPVLRENSIYLPSSSAEREWKYLLEHSWSDWGIGYEFHTWLQEHQIHFNWMSLPTHYAHCLRSCSASCYLLIINGPGTFQHPEMEFPSPVAPPHSWLSDGCSAGCSIKPIKVVVLDSWFVRQNPSLSTDFHSNWKKKSWTERKCGWEESAELLHPRGRGSEAATSLDNRHLAIHLNNQEVFGWPWMGV